MTTCWVVVYFPQNLDTFLSREESNLPPQLLLSLLQPSLSSHLKYLMLNKIVKREGTLPEGPPPLFACKAQKGPKRAQKGHNAAHVTIVPMPAALAGARLEA